jgi:hypothetical protein
MFFTKVREEPKFQTTNIFHGEPKWICLTHSTSLSAEKSIGDLYTDIVLYHFEFRHVQNANELQSANLDNHSISQYFGIMDIDIENAKNMSSVQFEYAKQEHLLLLKTELNRMGYKSYRIFFSGGKGYHVYIYDIKLWRIPEDQPILTKNQRLDWINRQVDLLFPTLADKLDKSIYRINNGIRSFTYPHPKKGTLNKEVFATDEAPVCHWSWFVDKFKTNNPIKVRCAINNQPHIQGIPSAFTNTRTIVQVQNGSLLDNARSICRQNSQATIPTLIEKTSIGSTKLYVVDSTYCPIKKADHSGKHKTYIIDKTISDSQVKIKCHSNSCIQKGHILFKKKTNALTCIFPLIQELFTNQIITSTPKRVRIIPANQKYIQDDDIEFSLNGGYGIISAPMGTGKTTALKTWLSKQPPEFKILLVVVRRTQAANFTGVYPGMVNYLDTEGSLYGLNSAVVCVNSLQRIRETGTGAIPHYDLLILDEIETILEGLLNPQLSCTKSKQCDIWKLFKILIYSSARVLFMDGIPTENTIRYLDEIKILGDCNLVEHSIQPDVRIYHNYSYLTAFEESFETDIRNKLKVCLVSNTKSSLLLFGNRAKSYGAVDCLEITGDSNDADKMTSSDPNNMWQRDILAFNTAVGPGASFDNLHFDLMYVIVSPMSCSPFWMYQLINRIRRLSQNKVKILVTWSEEKKIPTLADYETNKANNIVNMNWNQTKYPIPLAYFDSQSTDSFMLDISPENRHIIRKLVEEKRLVLRHEDNHFLKTLARYEHKKLTLNNTNNYSELLFDIIRRNGGTVKGELDYSKKNTVETIKTSTIMLKKDSNDYYNGTGINADNCITKKLAPYRDDVEFMKYINTYVSLNDINTHISWCSFRNALTQSEIVNYQRELQSLNDNSKALNNTLVYSNGLLESFKILCNQLSLDINYATGVVSGTGSVDNFLQNHTRINDNVEIIKNQLFSKNKFTGSGKNTYDERLSLSKKNTAIFKNLRFAFQQLGIDITKSKTSQRITNRGAQRTIDQRYAKWSYSVDPTSQYIRLALEGYVYDTAIRDENAMQIFKTRMYNSNV